MNVAELKGKVDFAIITIREDEMRAVLARFPHVIGTVSGRREYNVRRVSQDDPYTVAIVRSAGQGNGEAQQVANHLLDELAPRWLLVTGIAGGAPAFEYTLGDVVVSLAVADFSVGAVLQGGAREYALQGWVNHAEARKHAANLPALEGLGAWNSANSIGCSRPALRISPENLYGYAGWKKKVAATLEHHLAQGRQEPLVTAGAIACSDLVVKDTDLLKVWLKITRQVVAVEMESAGVHRAAHDRQVPFLSIRGLSDIVGFRRDPNWTEYACHSAAAFTRAFLLTRPIPPGDADRRLTATRRAIPPHAVDDAAAEQDALNDVRLGHAPAWAARTALVSVVNTLLEREFKVLMTYVSSLQRRADLDAEQREAFEELLSTLAIDSDATDFVEPLIMRADSLLRSLEYHLDPGQFSAAERLITESATAARMKNAGSERAAIDAWRGETRRGHERLIPFFPDAVGELLERVYVEIEVELASDARSLAVTTLFELLSETFRVPVDRSDPASPAPHRQESGDVDEAITAHDAGRWVIAGDPGSGKTTLARHVAWRFAAAATGPIPVYLSLARLVESGRHPFEEAEADLVAAIGPTGRGLCDGLFRAAKHRGGVCLMLDGFDEVPPGAVATIRARIRSWAYKLPHVAIAVLTRPIGYQTLEPDFRHARVRPLGASAQQELLKRWCTPAGAERTWRRLHQRGSRLRMITSNPLMLTLVAVLANEQDSLPLNRVQLYTQAIELLLRRGHCADRRGVKDCIAARRILGQLSYALQRRPQETWSKSQLHASIVELSAADPQNRVLLAAWDSAEDFLNDIARNSGLLGAHDGPREPWRYLHRSLREFLVAERLNEKFAAVARAGRSSEDAMVQELAQIDRDSAGRWGEPLSLLCGLTPQPIGLLKRVREVNPGLAWRALLNADTIDPVDTVRFISESEWQDHIEHIARTWIATQEEGDLKRAKDLLWLMIEPERTVKDLAIIHQTLEDIGLAPDREAFFSRAGRWPAQGAPSADELAMRRIPAGTFTMGLCHPALASPWDIKPSEQVVESFEMSSTPVTLRQYLAFASVPPAARNELAHEDVLDMPVTGLSWQEAYLFARWLGCHLPTEVQWEYACRAGTTTTFCSGDLEADLSRVGWFSGNSEGRMHPVGSKQPNSFGLHDMHGNVWEWCRDWSIPPGSTYDPDDYTDDHAGWRVLCGGSWFNEAKRARSAERSKWPSNKGYALIGFRVVRQ